MMLMDETKWKTIGCKDISTHSSFYQIEIEDLLCTLWLYEERVFMQSPRSDSFLLCSENVSTEM